MFPRIFQRPDKCICNFPTLKCFQSPFPKLFLWKQINFHLVLLYGKAHFLEWTLSINIDSLDLMRKLGSEQYGCKTLTNWQGRDGFRVQLFPFPLPRRVKLLPHLQLYNSISWSHSISVSHEVSPLSLVSVSHRWFCFVP